MPHTKLGWDWKGRPELADLHQALAPLGVHVYSDPSCEGSDSYGYIFSSEPLNRAQLRAIATEDEYNDEIDLDPSEDHPDPEDE